MWDGALSLQGEKEGSYFLRLLQTQSARAAGAGNGQREPFRPPGFLALEKRALSLLRPCVLPTPHLPTPPTPFHFFSFFFFLSFFLFCLYLFLLFNFFFPLVFLESCCQGRGARVAASVRRSWRTGTVRTTFPWPGEVGSGRGERPRGQRSEATPLKPTDGSRGHGALLSPAAPRLFAFVSQRK